jgi:hypothetical protein
MQPDAASKSHFSRLTREIGLQAYPLRKMRLTRIARPARHRDSRLLSLPSKDEYTCDLLLGVLIRHARNGTPRAHIRFGENTSKSNFS